MPELFESAVLSTTKGAPLLFLEESDAALSELSGLEAFGLGIGLSTGDVAAALLGSEERLEYTVVGDTVNLAQRLQDLARPSGVTVISSATMALLHDAPAADALPSQQVKGRDTPIQAYRIVHQPLQQEEQA